MVQLIINSFLLNCIRKPKSQNPLQNSSFQKIPLLNFQNSLNRILSAQRRLINIIQRRQQVTWILGQQNILSRRLNQKHRHRHNKTNPLRLPFQLRATKLHKNQIPNPKQRVSGKRIREQTSHQIIKIRLKANPKLIELSMNLRVVNLQVSDQADEQGSEHTVSINEDWVLNRDEISEVVEDAVEDVECSVFCE